MRKIALTLTIVTTVAVTACTTETEPTSDEEAYRIDNTATILCKDTHNSSSTVAMQACDNKDPIAQGCGADAVTVAGFAPSFPWGHIELRWSATCRTNWTRFTANYGAIWDVSVERLSPHLRVGDVVSINAGAQHYTNMVFAPGPAQACTNDVSSDNGACTGYTN